MDSAHLPTDLVTAGVASREANISQQTLHRWVLVGAIRTYGMARSGGRPSRLYSLSEVQARARERGLLSELQVAS